jgi:catechol 2,3-dioxygenase-like lactoylglutathione lyase family enzyme
MNGLIHKIALVTDDIEKAVEFYTTVVGLQVSERFPNEDDEDFVFLKSGDIILELMPQKTMAMDVGFHHISFKVDSVDEAANDVQDQGVALTVVPFDVGVGGIRLAFFNGPNDVQLQLFHRDNEA